MIKVRVTVFRIMTGEVFNVFHKKFDNLESAQKYVDAVKNRNYNVTAEIVD